MVNILFLTKKGEKTLKNNKIHIERKSRNEYQNEEKCHDIELKLNWKPILAQNEKTNEVQGEDILIEENFQIWVILKRLNIKNRYPRSILQNLLEYWK